MVVKKLPGNTRAADFAHVRGKNFSLQFRIEKIPISFELPWIEELGVICRARTGGNVSLVHDNELSVFVCVFHLSFPPFRWVDNLRKDQRRLDRIEHPARVKGLKEGITAAVVDVDEIFAGAPLRGDPL